MSVLWVKLLRDLWRARGQAIAIAAVIASGVASSAGSVATSRALTRSRELYYARAAMPDVFVEAVRAPLSIEGRMAAIPGVAEVETRSVGDARVEWPGGGARVRLISVAPDGGRLGRLHVREGRLPDDREGVISEGFAAATGLRPGSRILLTANGRQQSITVSGVALSPEWVYAIPPGGLLPEDRSFGLLWMPRRATDAALDLEGAFDEAVLRLSPGARPEGVIDALDAALLPFGGEGAIARAQLISNRFLSDEIRQLDNMATVLPAIFLAVAAFLVSVTLTRLVASQRMQIGTLKALGYGDGALALHYASYATAIALGGALVGAGIGHGLGAYMSRMYADFYRFPLLDYRADFGAMLRAALLAVVAALAGAAGAVHRAARLAPAEAMRQPAPGSYRPTLLERIGIGSLLPLPARMALRGLARRPLRAVLGALGIASAVAVLVTGGYFGDAMDHMLRLAFDRALTADATVRFTHPTSRSAVLELSRLPGVLAVEPIRELPAVLSHGSLSQRVVISAVMPGATLSRVVGEDGRTIALPSTGLVVSSRLASRLEARPGEPLRVRVLEGRRATGEVAIAATVDDVLGLSATGSLEVVRGLAREGDQITGAHLALDPAAREATSRALDARPMVAGVAWRTDTVKSFRGTITKTLLAFAGMLVAFAVAIAAGVVYSAVRASFAERSRELATLRVIGFTQGEVWRVLVGEVMLQLATALPLGALLGYLLSLLSSHAFESDLFRIPVVIARPTWLMGLGVTTVAALLTTIAGRRWVRRIDLADALRSEE